MRAVAVVPAGGTGARLGGGVPKQYRSLGGAPILVHTCRALVRCRGVTGLVLAVPADRVVATRTILSRHRVARVLEVVAGGAERQESVWRALRSAPADVEWVLVHDAVRPFVTPALVAEVLRAARSLGAASCGLPVRETVKRVRDGAVTETLDRAGLWLVQTPQAFRRDLLWAAHEKARRDSFVGTDDAVLVERLGRRVAMVPGLPENLKITTPADLDVARRWLGTRWSAAGRVRGPFLGSRR